MDGIIVGMLVVAYVLSSVYDVVCGWWCRCIEARLVLEWWREYPVDAVDDGVDGGSLELQCGGLW